MKKIFVLFAFISFLISCKQVVNRQSEIIDKKSGIDLEKTNFEENIARLYSKHVLNNEGVEYDSMRDGKISDTIFKYKISNLITDAIHLKVPKKEFGYLYKSPEIDSMAKFQNIYFNTLYTLTNMNKKPVAFYAEAKFDTPGLRKQCLDEFRKKYGAPKYSFYISHEFNQCSYEWDLNDRTIQIETSFGWEASFTSDGKNNNGKYYRLDMLIIENKYKNDIADAHVLEIPDKIMYEGKWHSYKDFQFEKSSKIKDEFLLNSTNEALLKDELGEYDITRAEDDE